MFRFNSCFLGHVILLWCGVGRACCARWHFGGGETKSLSSMLVAMRGGGGAFAPSFLAAIFVYIVIYMVLEHIKGVHVRD
jgi:hypothetical protein